MNTLFSDSATKFLTFDGLSIAYRIFGHGKPILFYNRFRGILDTWDPAFLDALAQHYSIVLFDYPGIGDSQGELSPDITAVARTGVQIMDALGFQWFYIAGWSYGGLVAQAAVFGHKERIEKAILIGTNPPGINEKPFDPSFFERALKPVNDLEDETIVFFEPASAHSRTAARSSFDRISIRLDRSKIPSTQNKFQQYFAGSAMMKQDPLDFRGQYKTLERPVLVISADHDVSFAVENWFPLLRNAPSLQHIILHNSGHGLQHQEPELVAAYIHVFLSQS